MIFSKKIDSPVSLVLTDLYGKEVSSKEISISQVNDGAYPLSLEGFTSGVYFLSIKKGEEKKVLKVIKR